MKTVGERIRHVRKSLDLTQEDLSDKLGVTSSHISGIERSRHKPSHQFITGFCNIFGIDKKWLAEGGDLSANGVSLHNIINHNGNGDIINGSQSSEESKSLEKEGMSLDKKISQLRELGSLKNDGVLTEKEFENLKSEILKA